MLKFSVVKEGAHPKGKYEENTVEAAFDSTAAAVGTAPHLIEPTAAVQRKPSHPHGTSFILTPTFYTNTSCDQSCPISKSKLRESPELLEVLVLLKLSLLVLSCSKSTIFLVCFLNASYNSNSLFMLKEIHKTVCRIAIEWIALFLLFSVNSTL